MEEDISFLDMLENKLEEKYTDLETRCMRILKESFRKYHQAFKTYCDVLVRKSLIHEDPYKYEQKISKVEVPPKGPIADSDKTDAIGMRLSAFEIQLDFLNNYYQFKTDELDLSQIKILAGLSQYILWDRMSPGCNNLNTRVLSEITDKVKGGSDSLSSNILGDAQNQMALSSGEIMACLKELMFYQKQKYKLTLRKTVLPLVRIDKEMSDGRREDAIRKIKHAFAGAMPGTPYFPELVNEFLDEDYTPQGAELHNDILTQLTVEKVKKVKKEIVDYKGILLDAVKALGSAGPSVYNAGIKMNENLLLLQSHNTSFSERFKKWLQNLVQKAEDNFVYDIEFFDETTSTSRTMKLDVKKFIEKTVSKGKLLGSASNKMATLFQKLEKAGESNIYSFLEKQIMETQEILHTLSALDTFFKTEVNREKRKEVKGVKIEITTIKNSILKANQKRYEYVSRKEEMEQLKKLGINTEVD